MLKWDSKIVKLWFKHSKNKKLSRSERELYLWLAINRNNIHRVIIHNGDRVLMFYNTKNDFNTHYQI